MFSALPLNSDIARRNWHFAFGPYPDIAPQKDCPLAAINARLPLSPNEIQEFQTARPMTAPIAAVAAIATAPQKVTRSVGMRTPDPPALAPIAPSTASPIKHAIDIV
jgi:hypothetical protein